MPQTWKVRKENDEKKKRRDIPPNAAHAAIMVLISRNGKLLKRHAKSKMSRKKKAVYKQTKRQSVARIVRLVMYNVVCRRWGYG